jgi:hypothetical protein
MKKAQGTLARYSILVNMEQRFGGTGGEFSPDLARGCGVFCVRLAMLSGL